MRLLTATGLGALVLLLSSWGFFAHRRINELAVYTLPQEMMVFFKRNHNYLIEAAVNPDRRRYAVAEEAARHYIDLDVWGDSAPHRLPKFWRDAEKKYGHDSLQRHGIVPWHIYTMYQRLKQSFLLRDPAGILKNAAELGHYVADAHVPLHASRNYDGQLTGQQGIHALWESRLPELFSERYNFFVGRATYEPDVQGAAWKVVAGSAAAVDSVLRFERALSDNTGRQFSFESKGRQTVKVVERSYATRYHAMLHHMVERRMRGSVRMIGNLWYTAWVDAGQPDLTALVNWKPTAAELAARKAEIEAWQRQQAEARDHSHDDGN